METIFTTDNLSEYIRHCTLYSNVYLMTAVSTGAVKITQHILATEYVPQSDLMEAFEILQEHDNSIIRDLLISNIDPTEY